MSLLPSKERQEWLESQILLAIENDGDWYRRTQRAVDEDNFYEFRRITNMLRRPLCRSVIDYDTVISDENIWSNLMLWMRRVGTYPTLRQATECAPMYAQIRNELLSGTEPASAPVQTSREQWLINTFVTPIAEDKGWQQAVHLASKLTSFRSRSRRYIVKYADSPQLYGLSCRDTNFILMLLWKKSGRALTKEFAQSNTIKTTETILSIFADHPELLDSEPQEQEIMNESNTAVAFETKHYVYGNNVTNMSEGQLIESIKRIENEITDLKGVKTKSKRITAKIDELNNMLAKVVEVLDAK